MSASSLSNSGPKFCVAICGAGIAGLVLAITIGKYDPSISINLYEAHDSIETAGVGITVWKQVHEVLIELGLFNDLKQIFALKPENSRGPDIRRSDIPQGGYLWYHRDHRYAPTSMHRQQMVAILEKHLPASCTVHSRKRLVSYIELEQQDAHSSPPIRLEFTDGTTATADLLVGADGVRSTVRKTLFETAASEDSQEDNKDAKADLRQYADATFSGTVAYRCLFPAEALKKEIPEHRSLKELNAYCGKGRYFLAYPIANGTLLNIAIVFGDRNLEDVPYEGRWVTDASREEVINRFDDFEPDVKTLVKYCDNLSKWAVHVTKLLPFCVRRRIALIGDACHAMVPYCGAGAGQAIDDAFVLGRLIAHSFTTFSRIPDVLRIYEQARLPFAQTVAQYSSSIGWMNMFMEPGYYDGTRYVEESDNNGVSAYERDGMEIMRQEILRRWEWMDGSKSALETWKEAEQNLHALVQSDFVN